MRADGKTNREIAHEVGRDQHTIEQVLYQLRRDGVAVARDPYIEARRTTDNRNVVISSEQAHKIVSLFDGGMKVSEIARRFDARYGTVWNIAHGVRKA